MLFPPLQASNQKPMIFVGKVISRRPTYAFIESEGYPRFICRTSKYQGLILKEGMKVAFEVGFSPKGAAALEPCEVT